LELEEVGIPSMVMTWAPLAGLTDVGVGRGNSRGGRVEESRKREGARVYEHDV
jgi:hypothetical protein